MNPTRRRFLGLLGTGTLAGGLAACGSTLPAANVAAPDFGKNATGTVKLWSRGNQLAVSLHKVVDRFHAAQDRIRVELTPIADAQYVTKLATAIRGNAVPDVVDMDCINSMLFIHRDTFTDLTDVVNTLPFKDKLSPGHMGLALRDGRYYGVPSMSDNSLIWCNQELFDRAGLSIPESTRSLDTMLEASRELRKLGGADYGFDFSGNSPGILGFVAQPHIWAAGTHLDIGEIGSQRANIAGNEALRSMLSFHRTLWKEKLVSPGNFSADGSAWGAEFRAGHVAMFPSSYGTSAVNATDELRAKMVPALLPGPTGGQSMFTGGTNMSIPRGAANPSAAWEYMQFALAIEQQAELPAGGFTPTRLDADTPEYRRNYPLAVLPLEGLSVGYAPRSLSYNLLFNQANSPWLSLFRRAVFDGDLEGALKDGQEDFNRIIEQGQL